MSLLLEDKENNQSSEMTEEDLNFLTDRLVSAMKTGCVIESDEDGGKKDSKNCHRCKKTIVAGEVVIDGSRNYHWKCFTCHHCLKPIGGETYFVGKNDAEKEVKYCKEHRDILLDKCTKCGDFIRDDLIKPGSDEAQYHPDCFTCSDCEKRIVGKFFNRNDGTYLCEKDYAKTREFCSVCSEPIMSAHLYALNRFYHPECFACHYCQKSLDGQQAFYTNDVIVCKDDYEGKLAETCSKCLKKILDETIIKTENSTYFHRLCYYEDSN